MNRFHLSSIVLIVFFICIEWMGRRSLFAIENLLIRKHFSVKLTFYIFLIVLMFLFYGKEQAFIYFQF